MKPHVLAVIPARGNSKRVKKKNIKLLGGKPLIAWTIAAAKKSTTIDHFLVSTDDQEIMDISKKYGAPTPFKRPQNLAVDCDTTLVLIHAVQKYEAYLNTGRWDVPLQDDWEKKVSHVVCLQPTSPFRTAADIDECVRIAETTNVECVVSFKIATQHPYWMFQTKPFGHEMTPFMREVPLEGENLVIQNLPTLFYPNGAVYVTRRDILMDGRIYGDQIFGYKMPEERSLDMETEMDFLVGEALIPILAKNEPFIKTSWMTS